MNEALDRKTEDERLPSSWREVISLPIVNTENPLWKIEELEELLLKAVRNTAEQALEENNGVINTTLSGGLDSSLCLLLLRKMYPKVSIKTFTIGSSNTHPDVIFARAASFTFGTLHHQIIIDQSRKAKLTLEFTSFYGNSPSPEGNINPWTVYQEAANLGVKNMVAHDGIDEQLGGYWPHRRFGPGSKEEDKQKQKVEFEYFWSRLGPDHLEILEKTTAHFGVKVLFPYLQKPLVEYISHIPVEQRASYQENKLPLRSIAQKYQLWPLILKRAKFGFVDALSNKETVEQIIQRQTKRF